MNIVVIANGFPTKDMPQYGSFEKDQAVALKKMGHNVSILYVDKKRHSIFKFLREKGIRRHKENGVCGYGVVLFPINTIERHFSFRLSFFMASRELEWGLRRVIEENGKPDVIYAHFLYNIAYAVYLKKIHNIPLVGMEHWSRLNEEKLPKSIIFMGNLAYRNSNLLISCADSLRKIIIKKFDKDSVVVHNMIGQEFLTAYNPHKKRREVVRFVSTGSLIYRKGFDVLIDAFAAASTKLPESQLLIIGGGEDQCSLQRRIENTKMSDHIKLLGRKTKKEIIEILSESDYFVLASRAENFSVAVLEALSAGLPVIATLCGGIQECIDESNGIIVPVEDINKLSDAIVKVVENENNYNRKAIAESAIKKYAPHNVANKISKLLESVY